jgi:serine protease Do
MRRRILMTARSRNFGHSVTALALVATLAISPLVASVEAQAASERPQFADLIEANRPAVVNIRTTMTRTPAGPGMRGAPDMGPGTGQNTPFDEFFRRFFGEVPDGAPRQHPPVTGQGSGFVISPEGHIVTNNHVIENASEVTVVFDDGSTLTADLIGTDPKTDLALLKVEADDNLPYASFGDSDKARIGDWIVAIGNPFGLGGTATAGIISARGRDLQAGPYDDFIQIDAPINRGNSGGPVFNTDGEVIGVNTMIYSPNGGSVGIGFAIPSALVTEIVADLKADGSVERGWLGVQIQGVTDEIADGLRLDESRGALIARVESGSPADEAGLKSGDVVLDYNGKDVETVKDLTRMVARTEVDDTVEVGVWRDGRRRERDVRIGALSEEPVQLASAVDERTGRLGLELAPLTSEKRRQYRIPKDVDGALVTNVDPRGPAATQGVRPGDVISMVGQTPVESPDQVRDEVEAAAEDDRDHVLLRIERNGGSRFIAMKLA